MMAHNHFDPDALLAALPRRSISPVPQNVVIGAVRRRTEIVTSAVGQRGEYNGFSGRERERTAAVSNWLTKLGCTQRCPICDICGAAAVDEHAEDYYDLTSWIGLCRICHRTILHGRFAKPNRWDELLDDHELPASHWARLVSPVPFDLAGLLRSRGAREPIRADFRVLAD